MILKEGDKVKKLESQVVYQVKKILGNGSAILSEENGLKTALISLKELGVEFMVIHSHIEGKNVSM